MNEISDSTLDERITSGALKLNSSKNALVTNLLILKVDKKT